MSSLRFSDGTVSTACSSLGTAASDRLCGSESADEIAGLGGDDDISGGAGDDNLRGGRGNDTVRGGAGNDVLRGDAGDDTLEGGTGDDRYVYTAADDRITIVDEAGEDTVVCEDAPATSAREAGEDLLLVFKGGGLITIKAHRGRGQIEKLDSCWKPPVDPDADHDAGSEAREADE